MSASTARYTLDLSRVLLMNSSGIHALASFVLATRQAATPLRILCDAGSAWQRKTIASLKLLDARLELEMVTEATNPAS